MNQLIKSASLFALLLVFSFNVNTDSKSPNVNLETSNVVAKVSEGCSDCTSTSEEECVRIIHGNNVDIYYGDEEPCS